MYWEVDPVDKLSKMCHYIKVTSMSLLILKNVSRISQIRHMKNLKRCRPFIKNHCTKTVKHFVQLKSAKCYFNCGYNVRVID